MSLVDGSLLLEKEKEKEKQHRGRSLKSFFFRSASTSGEKNGNGNAKRGGGGDDLNTSVSGDTTVKYESSTILSSLPEIPYSPFAPNPLLSSGQSPSPSPTPLRTSSAMGFTTPHKRATTEPFQPSSSPSPGRWSIDDLHLPSSPGMGMTSTPLKPNLISKSPGKPPTRKLSKRPNTSDATTASPTTSPFSSLRKKVPEFLVIASSPSPPPLPPKVVTESAPSTPTVVEEPDDFDLGSLDADLAAALSVSSSSRTLAPVPTVIRQPSPLSHELEVEEESDYTATTTPTTLHAKTQSTSTTPPTPTEADDDGLEISIGPGVASTSTPHLNFNTKSKSKSKSDLKSQGVFRRSLSEHWSSMSREVNGSGNGNVFEPSESVASSSSGRRGSIDRYQSSSPASPYPSYPQQRDMGLGYGRPPLSSHIHGRKRSTSLTSPPSELLEAEEEEGYQHYERPRTSMSTTSPFALGPRTRRAFEAAGLLDRDVDSPSERWRNRSRAENTYTYGRPSLDERRPPPPVEEHTYTYGRPRSAMGWSGGGRRDLSSRLGLRDRERAYTPPSRRREVEHSGSFATRRERDRSVDRTHNTSSTATITAVSPVLSGSTLVSSNPNSSSKRRSPHPRSYSISHSQSSATTSKIDELEDELKSTKEKHAAELAALLGALGDSQLLVKELRARIKELEDAAKGSVPAAKSKSHARKPSASSVISAASVFSPLPEEQSMLMLETPHHHVSNSTPNISFTSTTDADDEDDTDRINIPLPQRSASPTLILPIPIPRQGHAANSSISTSYSSMSEWEQQPPCSDEDEGGLRLRPEHEDFLGDI